MMNNFTLGPRRTGHVGYTASVILSIMEPSVKLFII